MKNRIGMVAVIGCLVAFPMFAGKGKKTKKAPKPASVQQRSRVTVQFDTTFEKGKETAAPTHYLVDKELVDRVREFLAHAPASRQESAVLHAQQQTMTSVRNWTQLSCLLSSSVLFFHFYNLYFGKENVASNQAICSADQNAKHWAMELASMWGKTLFNGASLTVSICNLGITGIIYWDKIKNFLRKFA